MCIFLNTLQLKDFLKKNKLKIITNKAIAVNQLKVFRTLTREITEVLTQLFHFCEGSLVQ